MNTQAINELENEMAILEDRIADKKMELNQANSDSEYQEAAIDLETLESELNHLNNLREWD